MHKFKNLCEDGLLGPADYRIFEDWSAIDKLQEKYIRIKDGLVSVGEVQEMNDEEEGPYKERIRGFFLGIPPGGCLSLLALVLPSGP
jgi:hypothetical protein